MKLIHFKEDTNHEPCLYPFSVLCTLGTSYGDIGKAGFMASAGKTCTFEQINC